VVQLPGMGRESESWKKKNGTKSAEPKPKKERVKRGGGKWGGGQSRKMRKVIGKRERKGLRDKKSVGSSTVIKVQGGEKSSFKARKRDQWEKKLAGTTPLAPNKEVQGNNSRGGGGSKCARGEKNCLGYRETYDKPWQKKKGHDIKIWTKKQRSSARRRGERGLIKIEERRLGDLFTSAVIRKGKGWRSR